MAFVKIYELLDPETNMPRYVGKTVTELSDRLKVHVHQSKNARKPTHKEAWIKGLLKKGLKPVIKLIEEVEGENWVEREVFWISEYRKTHERLCNLSDGGDGYSGIRHSDEFKATLSERMKGNKFGVGFKWTDSQREKMAKSRANPWNKGKKGLIKASDKQRSIVSALMTGEKHPKSKLSDMAVNNLRSRFTNGESVKDLAKEVNITYSHMNKILKNKSRCVRS